MVTLNTSAEFVQIPSILTSDPVAINEAAPFYIEVKAPVGWTPPAGAIANLYSLQACGTQITEIDGAMGSFTLTNLALTQVDVTDRYAVYRSVKPIVGTTRTLLPGEYPPPLDPAYEYVQMTDFGAVSVGVPFSPEETLLKIRRAGTGKTGKLPGGEEFRKLIYPKSAEICFYLRGYAGTDAFAVVEFGDGTQSDPITEIGTDPIVTHVYTPTLRRQTYPVTVTVSYSDDGPIVRKHYDRVRVAADIDLGQDLSPITPTQTFLDAYGWTITNPVTFNIVPPAQDQEWTQTFGVSLNEKRLALTLPGSLIGAYGITMLDDLISDVYGAYISPSAWQWKKEELDGIVEHEKMHVLRGAEARDNADSLPYKLTEALKTELSDDSISGTKITKLLTLFDHAKIFLIHDLSSDYFSFKSLTDNPFDPYVRIHHFFNEYRAAYKALVEGEKITISYDSIPPRLYVIQVQLSSQLKTDIKAYYNAIYSVVGDEFPELLKREEFDLPIQLIRPK